VDTHILNILSDDDILEPIMRSMFQSTNIQLTNSKHHTNITNLHQQKDYNESKHIIKMVGLINLDKIDINQQEKMNNSFQNLHHKVQSHK